MSYDAAIAKAWEQLSSSAQAKILSVRFFDDEYAVDVEKGRVISLSCNAPAKDWTAILVLHYLIQKLKFLPEVTGEWISFKEVAGGESYYPAFRKRAIDPVIRKYGKNPQGLYACLERLPGRKLEQADAAVRLEVFENVPAIVELWKGDEEFGPDANILFDRSIGMIFCTEDVAVLGGYIAKQP
ncbi:MAG: DUF3786 domain-containing protein [Candidatus Omnitrophica bacterium]|nr:DUF3786 domain-containing protein [Candidatus Omnitrophota bacterium]